MRGVVAQQVFEPLIRDNLSPEGVATMTTKKVPQLRS